jgi:hypothetical protein
MLFDVFQQRRPLKTDWEGPSMSGHEFKTPFEVDIVRVGAIDARSGSEAIDLAKKMPVFRTARQLARWPLVAPARNA